MDGVVWVSCTIQTVVKREREKRLDNRGRECVYMRKLAIPGIYLT